MASELYIRQKGTRSCWILASVSYIIFVCIRESPPAGLQRAPSTVSGSALGIGVPYLRHGCTGIEARLPPRARYPFPRWRPQLGAKPMNISIRAKLSVEREPVIGHTLIDMRGRKPAWEGIMVSLFSSNHREPA